jgi:hypothetical protein
VPRANNRMATTTLVTGTRLASSGQSIAWPSVQLLSADV